MPSQRSKNRSRVTLNFPDFLHDAISKTAKKKKQDDFSEAVILALAEDYPEIKDKVVEFLKEQSKFKPKKKK